MMNVVVKRMVEIAGGVVIGCLANEAVKEVGKGIKKGVKKVKAKMEEKDGGQ